MTAVLVIPVVLSMVLLAAHVSRAGLPWPVAVLVVALAGLLAVPRRWAARTLELALILGALEWLRTTVILASARRAAGLPATRLVVILVAVALVTGASALVFRHPRLRRRFRLG